MNPAIVQAIANLQTALAARETAIATFRAECSKFVARGVPVEVVNAREQADETVRVAYAALGALLDRELR